MNGALSFIPCVARFCFGLGKGCACGIPCWAGLKSNLKWQVVLRDGARSNMSNNEHVLGLAMFFKIRDLLLSPYSFTLASYDFIKIPLFAT
jgi:hypothetical protein